MEKIDSNYCLFPLLFIVNHRLDLLWFKRVGNQTYIWGKGDDYELIPMIIFKAILNVKHTYKKV